MARLGLAVVELVWGGDVKGGSFFGGGFGIGETYGYLARASEMMPRECRHCACTLRSLSVGTSS